MDHRTDLWTIGRTKNQALRTKDHTAVRRSRFVVVDECEQLFALPACVRKGYDDERRSSPDARAPSSMPLVVLHASARVWPHANGVVSCDVSIASTRGSQRRRSRAFEPSPTLEEAAASRQSGALSRGRSRSPAWWIALRACLHGCDALPLARTRPPASSATFPAVCLCARVRLWPSQAWRSSMGS